MLDNDNFYTEEVKYNMMKIIKNLGDQYNFENSTC